MAQPNILDIFEESLNRLADGKTIDECLSIYPDYAVQLRPMLESVNFVSTLRPTDAEIRTDQALVWQQILRALPDYEAKPPTRRRPRVLLLVAVLLLPVLMAAGIVALSRINTPPEVEPIIVPSQETPITELPSATFVTTTEAALTHSLTHTPTLTSTPAPPLTNTQQPSPLPSSTSFPSIVPTNTLVPTFTLTHTQVPPTATRTPAATLTARPTNTPRPPTRVPVTPTATFVPGCGAPLTMEDAVRVVLGIYPNTTISEIKLTDDFGDRAVWEVRTSHGLEVNIDVACGTILSIDRRGSSSTNTPGDNSGSNSGSGSSSGNSGSGSDNSGSGSDDSPDDDDDPSGDDDG